MNAYEIIRAAIPDASDDLCEYVLWARTPFPCGEITSRSIFEAAHRVKRANDKHIRLCDFCESAAKASSRLCAKHEQIVKGWCDD